MRRITRSWKKGKFEEKKKTTFVELRVYINFYSSPVLQVFNCFKKLLDLEVIHVHLSMPKKLENFCKFITLIWIDQLIDLPTLFLKDDY